MLRRCRPPASLVLLTALAAALPAAAGTLDNLMQDFHMTSMGLKPAPAFSLDTVGGGTTAPGDHRGRPLLLYFWATW